LAERAINGTVGIPVEDKPNPDDDDPMKIVLGDNYEGISPKGSSVTHDTRSRSTLAGILIGAGLIATGAGVPAGSWMIANAILNRPTTKPTSVSLEVIPPPETPSESSENPPQ
jgi:hypothetical protein